MSTGPETLFDRIRDATADEYLVDREIGRGGMAAVFLARDLALDRRVAIKVMLPDLISVEGLQDRFVIEARTAAHLDHAGIVTVYSVKQRDGLLFIAMKYIEGQTLEAVMRSKGTMDAASVAFVGGRVADALAFAHGEGIVHRDIKPSNIMIDNRGRPVVTDFGIARVTTAQSITVAGSMMGTPTHMSPEQCFGLPATPASDQYALGVTMFEMLTGRAPFGGSFFELITAHREQAPPLLTQFVSGVDPELEYTVMRMLAKRPEDRWDSLTEVAQRLTMPSMGLRGDESLRATVMSLQGGASSYVPTPEHSHEALGLLTPPGDATPGSTVPPIFGTPVPVPVTVPLPYVDADRASVTSAETPNAAPVHSLPSNEGAPSSRGPLIFGILGLATLAILLTVFLRPGSSSLRGANSPDRADSVTATPPLPPPTPTPAAAIGDSATAAVAKATRDSIVRDSVVRDSVAHLKAFGETVARDSAAKAAAARSARANDSNSKGGAVKPPTRSTVKPPPTPESLAKQCARIVERLSIGETLTDSELTFLRQQRCKLKGL